MHLVRAYRLQRGWTMKELANRAGITTRVIYKIEQNPGYNAKRETMKSISAAMNLPASMLFFPEEEIRKREMLSNMFIHTMDVISQANMLQPPSVDRTVSSAKGTTVESSVQVHHFRQTKASPSKVNNI